MKFKKIICIMLAVLFVLTCGCSTTEKSARTEFENMMQAFKTHEKSHIDKYYSFNAITNYIDKADGEEFRDSILSTLDKLEYRIVSTEMKDEKTVLIRADVTTVDFSMIIDEYISNLIETVESKEYQAKMPAMTDIEYKTMLSKMMSDAIEKCGDNKTTQPVDVLMINDGSGWKLGGEADSFLGVLFAEMSKAVESLS